MRTVGVDLAAESKGTAIAVIDWNGVSAKLIDLRLGISDESIAEVAPQADKIGIDCAFGWPDEFVNFVAVHADLKEAQPRVDGGMSWRRTLAYRETDRAVQRKTGRWPLSVSTDRLGLTAMRCAALLQRLEEEVGPIDRAGSGKVVEIYPGGSLRAWGFDVTGYRTDRRARELLLTRVLELVSWLDISGLEQLMVDSADAFDAVIASLAARNAAVGHYELPPAEHHERARREGWIALPTGAVADLLEEPPETLRRITRRADSTT